MHCSPLLSQNVPWLWSCLCRGEKPCWPPCDHYKWFPLLETETLVPKSWYAGSFIYIYIQMHLKIHTAFQNVVPALRVPEGYEVWRSARAVKFETHTLCMLISGWLHQFLVWNVGFGKSLEVPGNIQLKVSRNLTERLWLTEENKGQNRLPS